MTAVERLAGAPFTRGNFWKAIDWSKVRRMVRRVQIRIAKAVKEGRYGKAKALQWLLTHSFYGKLLAVKRVVSNRGKNTPGVDAIIWSTPEQKMQAVHNLGRRGYRPLPLRRIYIPKKNGKMRPLSIPTMRDRAMQALHSLALQPVAETQADPNSYGFRLYRSCADAIQQCFNGLAKRYSARWILEGDIKACFDDISHKWLEEHVLMDRSILQKWLKAGYIEEGIQYPTKAGTPQGGIISPLLANITLDGLEAAVKSVAPYRSKVNVIRYADDFVITAKSKEILETRILPVIEEFLTERGLTLSSEKTQITRIEDGFDFLGQNVRKYGDKLLIKPAGDNTKAFLSKVKETIRKYTAQKTVDMIRAINPKILGWANYHRHMAAKSTFKEVDNRIFSYLLDWAKRRHPDKGKRWLVRKYWFSGLKSWIFSAEEKTPEGKRRIKLIQASSIRIERHIKVRCETNPYDPKDDKYFRLRKAGKTIRQAACTK